MAERETWLITGCSSGLGRSLALTALEQGKNVIVTARNPEKLAEFSERFPDTALLAQLDVTDDASVDAAITKGLAKFGRIDVLVNNAGYCLRGAVEECSEIEIRRQFDTNFFGTVRTIQKVLPHMREVRKGAIVNFSSIAALCTSEGSAFYGASKCAVEGLSDGLRKEVGPLGIKVMVVEPGPFRTDFFSRSIDICSRNIDDYKETAGKRKIKLQTPPAPEFGAWGDLYRGADVIIKAVEMPDGPFHLLLGSTAISFAESCIGARERELNVWKKLSIQADGDD